MKIIVGLGNPGREYEGTRHNVGFAVLDKLAEMMALPWQHSPQLLIEWNKNGNLILAKPQSFMNLSGQPIELVKSFYKVSASDICVVYDDVDLPLGELRWRESGSAGTHNGMRSVVEILKTKDFPRLRIGIGPQPEKWELSSFVLSKFTTEEQGRLEEVVEKAIRRLLTWSDERQGLGKESANNVDDQEG